MSTLGVQIDAGDRRVTAAMPLHSCAHMFTDQATFAEFVREATQALYAAWPVCEECRGTGDLVKADRDDRGVQCPACGGSGVKGGE